MAAMAFYGLLIYFVHKSTTLSKAHKTLIISGLSILIFLIGISRVYLGVHYASDILGGFSTSLAYLILFTYYSDKYLKGKKK